MQEIFGSHISGYESKPINKVSDQENEALINLLREDSELGSALEDEEEIKSKVYNACFKDLINY